MGFIGAPLSGTPCGVNHKEQWCFNGFCVYKSNRDVKPILAEAEWTHWHEWDECSRSCGVGVKYRTRECKKPEDSPLAKCTGDSNEMKICNTMDCNSYNDLSQKIDY